MKLRVSVIILNWNNWRSTVETVESVHLSNFRDYDVIVVDNGSKDDSIQKIKEYGNGRIRINSDFIDFNEHNKPLHVFELDEDDAKRGQLNRQAYSKVDPNRRLILIKNRKNYGFGGGNNVGIKFALTVLKADYVLLLNNDALVTPETISKLVETAERTNAGAVTPKIIWARDPALIDSAGGEYSKNGYSFDRGKFQPVDTFGKMEEVSTVCAACTLYSSQALEEAGLFNDRLFFLYYEDTDLASRIRWTGRRLIYEPKAIAYHYGGKSTGGLEVSDLAVEHSLKGHLICAVLNLPRKYAPMYITGNFVYAFYNSIVRRKTKAVARGYSMLLSTLPLAMKERKRIRRNISEKEFSKLLVLKWRAF